MDATEALAARYLESLGLGPVVYEPDGNVPPDFVLGTRVAVEVRRLNQGESLDGRIRGYEETRIPLIEAVRNAIAESGPPRDHSWFVSVSFRRPAPAPRTAYKIVREALLSFRGQAPPASLVLAKSIRLRFLAASKLHDHAFVLGGYSDTDAGGFVLGEMLEYIPIYVREKARKVAKYRHRYPEWWLVLVDLIGYGAGLDEREELASALKWTGEWQKIILVSPLDPTKAVVLP
jgi:hypothetical protein